MEIFDSFFARTVSETASMCALMGGRTILTGMRPSVAITATHSGLPCTRSRRPWTWTVPWTGSCRTNAGEVGDDAPDVTEVPIRVESDIVHARRAVREASTALGFGLTDTTRIVTAASELAKDISSTAGTGSMQLRSLEGDLSVGIEITFEDHGPGIADLEQAMQEGFSTSGGLGMGLPGARRLMDELDLESTVSRGTTVRIRKWRRA